MVSKRRIANLAALAMLASVLGLAGPRAVLAAEEVFAGTFSAENQVPPPEVPEGYAGTGRARVTIEDHSGAPTLWYKYRVSGLAGGADGVHLHYGAPGVRGPVMFHLCAQADLITACGGQWTEQDFRDSPQVPTFPDALEAIRNGQAYLDVHTPRNRPGEVRANLAHRLEDTAAASASTPSTSLALVFVVLAAGAAVGLGLGARRFARRVARGVA